MKLLLIFLAGIFSAATTDIADNDLKFIGTVELKNESHMTLKIEEVVDFGKSIRTVPNEGEDITISLPGQRPPEKNSRVIIYVREKTVLGATPSGYIMLKYETVH